MKSNQALLFSLFLIAPAAFAQNDSNSMNHTMHMAQPQAQAQAPDSGSLMQTALPTEAGNDAFGTIQEIITLLNNDPNTDWKQVNIEALRQHLVDMHDMTINVTVISQKAIPGGLIAVIEPSTPRAAGALQRVMQAHPAQLARETGWQMKVDQRRRRYALTVTTDKPQEVDKIRGLGYIGLMAYGAHHQPHHWAMAKGMNPHKM